MNRRVIWIIELVLWAIVAIFISFVFVFANSLKEQESNSYYLFFSDIDGLMKGSPVRLMGKQIGYVQDIKVFDSKVFVSFLITENNVKIPEQATATVEFYGLGGSKSLEINPSLAGNNGKEDIIITKEPYRVQDFYDVQSSMAKTLVKMTNSFTASIKESNIHSKRKVLKVSSKVKKLNEDMIEMQSQEMDIMKKTQESSESLSKKINKLNNQEENNASTAN